MGFKLLTGASQNFVVKPLLISKGGLEVSGKGFVNECSTTEVSRACSRFSDLEKRVQSGDGVGNDVDSSWCFGFSQS